MDGGKREEHEALFRASLIKVETLIHVVLHKINALCCSRTYEGKIPQEGFFLQGRTKPATLG
jgi:hypothetical protein